MVYESDFYTTRRPYSSRPHVSSYSVTTPYRVLSVPIVSRVHTYTTLPIYSGYPTVFHRTIPYVAHKRLVTGTRLTTSPPRVITRSRIFSTPIRVTRSVTPLRSVRSVTPYRYTTPVRSVTPFRYTTPVRSMTPLRAVTPISVRYPITPVTVLSEPFRYVHSYTTPLSNSPPHTNFSVRVRPSILNREYDRILNKPRTYPHYSYIENYLNSNAVRAFDDETKDIRSRTNALMRKIHERVPRAQSALPITAYASKFERRYGPDSFVSSLSGPLKSTIYNGLESYNPHKFIGKSHLASVRIVGNKAYNTRHPLSVYDDDKIRNDVNLLSFYLKNRKAAADNKEPDVILASAKKKAEAIERPELTEVA